MSNDLLKVENLFSSTFWSGIISNYLFWGVRVYWGFSPINLFGLYHTHPFLGVFSDE